ncbi:hypothetical protein [Dechloromonas denitrificans]|uniref:hypothetical protein n=1 Tax=Dechloromonas denitrificans TaxID=281362 RepID=UPI001CF85B38|nr:hypothetical protein [Dechloromonas denitrificans]UCV03005.1 hypothetical protein KI611_18305 [Dechloromonas denitrificans]
MAYFLITLATAPIWFPVTRLAILLFKLTSRLPKTVTWWYVVTLLWTVGWVVFLVAVKIPSGIGYGIALASGWLLMFGAISTDVISLFHTLDASKGATVTKQNGETSRARAVNRFSLGFVLALGVAVGTFWISQTNHQTEIEKQKLEATEFVRTHHLVKQNGGKLEIPIVVAFINGNNGLPARYEFALQPGYAIVDVVKTSGENKYHLDCITSISLSERDNRIEACNQGVVSKDEK